LGERRGRVDLIDAADFLQSIKNLHGNLKRLTEGIQNVVFGPLANEIGVVAKRTIGGSDEGADFPIIIPGQGGFVDLLREMYSVMISTSNRD